MNPKCICEVDDLCGGDRVIVCTDCLFDDHVCPAHPTTCCVRDCPGCADCSAQGQDDGPSGSASFKKDDEASL